MTKQSAAEPPTGRGARDATSRAAAVVQLKHAVWQHWSAWRHDHRRAEHTPAHTDPPVGIRVGPDHDHPSWVATVHYPTTIHGHRWHSIACGPSTDIPTSRLTSAPTTSRHGVPPSAWQHHRISRSAARRPTRRLSATLNHLVALAAHWRHTGDLDLAIGTAWAGLAATLAAIPARSLARTDTDDTDSP